MERIVGLPYCVSCCGVLNFARWEVPLKMSGEDTFQAVSRIMVENNVMEDGPFFRDEMQKKLSLTDFTCVCCLNILRQKEVFQLCEEIVAGIDELDPNIPCVMLDIQLPATIEVCRVMSRFLIKEHTKPNPRFETVLEKMISWYLITKRQIEVKSSADMKISIHFHMMDQLDLCMTVFPDFRPKKQRKRVYPGEENDGDENEDADKEEEEENLSQSNVDKVLIAIRGMSSSALQAAEPKFLSHMKTQRVSHKLSVDYGTVFVYGRYWKFVRDVPQSAWTISAHQEVNSHEASMASDKTTAAPAVLRVGRASVTEIVRDAVIALTKAKDVLLHGCGREDIDVRCLGNGRPFVLQIIAPKVPITSTLLREIETLINEGVDHQKDIAVDHLQITTAKTWEIMQKEAEEKKKAYRCVCYSSRAISKQELHATFNDRNRWKEFAQQQRAQADDTSNGQPKTDAQLLLLDRTMVDEEGLQYLFTVQQHTPLRVMHRRVLLERRRAIYAIEAEYLNEHFFLLSLITGAGTYVKEFVHGDLGRTQPNVGSLLGNTETEILQLDVIWLYDHFDRLLLPGGEKAYEEHQQRLHQRWMHRRKLLYAHQQSRKAAAQEDKESTQEPKRPRAAEDVDGQVDSPINASLEVAGGEEKEETGEWLELPKLPCARIV